MATGDYLQSQGIIDPNEQFETLYLAEEEIEKFMEKYLKENPGTEIETRYVNHPPIELTQNIEVRWLRPETPEIPPIIIKEMENNEPELPPIRIIEKRKEKEENVEPVIIREKPPFVIIPEPKIAYVQNLAKKDINLEKKEIKSEGKPIKIEHVRSESFNDKSTSSNLKNRYDYDDQFNKDRLYSFEEHASFIDYEEEYDGVPDDTFRSKARYEDEYELRLYEEKLKQTLYEEYLLRLERERLERKLSKSGLLEERLRERSISQERMTHLSNRLSSVRAREEDKRLRQINESLHDNKRYRKDYQTTNSSNSTKPNGHDISSRIDLGQLPRTDSQKRYFDDLKAYETFNNGKDNMSTVPDNFYQGNSFISKSGSSNGIRRHRITTIKKFYSNLPNQNYEEKSLPVNSSILN